MKPFAPIEKEYFPISNAVADQLVKNLSGNEWKMLFVIIRLTMGWNKYEDEISYSQLMERTGISCDKTITRLLNSLKNKNLIDVISAPGLTNIIVLNRDFELPALNRRSSADFTHPTTGAMPEGTTGTMPDTKDIPLKTPYIYSGTPKDGFDYDALSVPEGVDQQVFSDAFYMWRDYTYEIGKPLVPSQMGILINEWKEKGHARFMAAVKHSIINQWKSIHEPQQRQAPNGNGRNYNGNGNKRVETSDNQVFDKTYDHWKTFWNVPAWEQQMLIDIARETDMEIPQEYLNAVNQ